MNVKTDKYTVGVMVARFQVPHLHDGHIELINSVIAQHPKVLIFLGLSPTKGTINNPLDFQPRKQLVLEKYPPAQYPNLTVGYIKDSHSDEVWSEALDRAIQDHLSPKDTVVLYGSRDSFIPHYHGKYETRELVATRYVSGTEIRKEISQAPQSNPDFRRGAIWATYQRYPVVLSTVDVVVYDKTENKVLLARKPSETKYRFVGGFVDPKDNSFEDAATRELMEETGINAPKDNLVYLGSFKVDDWRYRAEVDKIITHFYLAYYTFGRATAADDIAEVRWFPVDAIKTTGVDLIVDEHKPLMHRLIDELKKE